LLLFLPGLLAGGDPEPPSYALHQSSANSGGRQSTSTSYRLTASAGQPLTVGTSSSFHYVLQSGFWSFLGSGLVPVILSVDKNAVTAGNVDLSWSGNNPPYDIYQATDCSNVFAGYFDTTAANSYPDVAPPEAGLVCFNVLASAPGPVPLRGAPSSPDRGSGHPWRDGEMP
jgi:hypothetical protein